jgi:hypothetical protein
VFDFIDRRCEAEWRNSADELLPCPSEGDVPLGSLTILNSAELEDGETAQVPALVMRPEAVDAGSEEGGWVEGIYPAYTVQPGDRFKTTIGCLANNPDCRVGFVLNAKKVDGTLVNLGTWEETSDGQIRVIELGLNALVGEQIRFGFLVYGEAVSLQNVAFWLRPGLWR